VSQVVAIMTAKLPEIHGLFDLVGADELTDSRPLMMLALIVPGKLSADQRLVCRAFGPEASG
jgi:hypothetical protein